MRSFRVIIFFLLLVISSCSYFDEEEEILPGERQNVFDFDDDVIIKSNQKMVPFRDPRDLDRTSLSGPGLGSDIPQKRRSEQICHIEVTSRGSGRPK